jgi:hypothetical protein
MYIHERIDKSLLRIQKENLNLMHNYNFQEDPLQ